MDVCNASRRDVMEGGECRVENRNSFIFLFFSLFILGLFSVWGGGGEERRGGEEEVVGRWARFAWGWSIEKDSPRWDLFVGYRGTDMCFLNKVKVLEDIHHSIYSGSILLLRFNNSYANPLISKIATSISGFSNNRPCQPNVSATTSRISLSEGGVDEYTT